MRYLVLAALLVMQGTSAQSSGVWFPERYEMPPCGQEGPNLHVILPTGQMIPAMRIEDVAEQTVWVVGYSDNRIFCDRMGP